MPKDTAANANDSHCSVDDFLDFLLDGSAEGNQKVESHVGNCLSCAELLGQVSRVYLVVDNWTGQRNTALRWKLSILKALEAAPLRPENSEWASQLENWIKKFARHAQAALGVHISSPREGSLSFFGERTGIMAQGGWEFVPAVMAGGEAIRTADVRGIPDARVELRTTTPRSTGGSASVAVRLPRDYGLRGKATLALLVPEHQPDLARIEPLRQQADGAWSAEFAGLEAGSYIVILEPLQAPEHQG